MYSDETSLGEATIFEEGLHANGPRASEVINSAVIKVKEENFALLKKARHGAAQFFLSTSMHFEFAIARGFSNGIMQILSFLYELISRVTFANEKYKTG